MEKANAASLVEAAYLNIREDIAMGRLAQGARIKIRELVDRYQFSETPIKQALNRLVAEGLVESIPNRGMKVRTFTRSQIEDILEVRLMLETFCVPHAIAALAGDPSLADQLRENIDKHFSYAENVSDMTQYYTAYKLDQEFHESYLRLSGNPKMVEIHQGLHSHAYATYLYGKQSRERTLEGVREHQRILEALLAGDEALAIERIRIHNQNCKDIIDLILKLSKTT
ncbi:MAG: GntR family transcriptional regulator [Clostridia bacterium]|nr:GntR family transcriptional regulator [Clostridia bacterium]